MNGSSKQLLRMFKLGLNHRYASILTVASADELIN
jgi:hypothetical protein